MDKFLDEYNQPKLNHDDINHLNSPVTYNETEALIKSLPTKNRQGPDGFTAKFYQTFKEELTPIILKLFQKGKEHYQTHSMKLILYSFLN
jgi:hypothetical protein